MQAMISMNGCMASTTMVIFYLNVSASKSYSIIAVYWGCWFVLLRDTSAVQFIEQGAYILGLGIRCENVIVS